MVYCLIRKVGGTHCKECGTKFISMVIIFQTRHKTEGTHFFHPMAPSTRRVELSWHRSRSYYLMTYVSFVVCLGDIRGSSSLKLSRYHKNEQNRLLQKDVGKKSHIPAFGSSEQNEQCGLK